MEKAKELLSLKEEESKAVDGVVITAPRRLFVDGSFFEAFILRGIRVDRVEPGALSCSFTVPPRLTDRDGNLSSGAVADLVDEVGGAVIRTEGGRHMKVSTDMNIALMSSARANDELEITSRVLGNKGRYTGTIVVLKNKNTGEIVAEGRHSLYGNFLSKI